MTGPSPIARRGVPWLCIGLAVSLALNAFFVGAIATDAFRFSAAEKRHVNFELRWLEERLAPDDFERWSRRRSPRRGRTPNVTLPV